MPDRNATKAQRAEQRALALHVIQALCNDARQDIQRAEEQMRDGNTDSDVRLYLYDARRKLDFLNEKDSRWVETTLDQHAPLCNIVAAEAELLPLRESLRYTKRLPRTLRESMLGRINRAIDIIQGRCI